MQCYAVEIKNNNYDAASLIGFRDDDECKTRDAYVTFFKDCDHIKHVTFSSTHWIEDAEEADENEYDVSFTIVVSKNRYGVTEADAERKAREDLAGYLRDLAVDNYCCKIVSSNVY